MSFDENRNCEIFKEFYSNLASNLLKKLPAPTNKFNIESVRKYYHSINKGKSFDFKESNQQDIAKLLTSIDSTKAVGIDNISGLFLKDGASCISQPLSQIFNLSIKLSKFPSLCKATKIKPLFKKCSKTEPKNYRPISLLPLISKIFEKVVHDQTQKFLIDNNLLYKYQSGFRPNHSTNSCLTYLTNKILTGFDTGMVTGMILIDLQKAFDTIDYEILLQKLSCLNFSERTINWFQSYLYQRSFKIFLGDSSSSSANLSCGVPQGSILGPLLFLIYVNDMPSALKFSDLYLYADDSCIVFQSKNIDIIKENLTNDFSELCDWFVDNKLSIHFAKIKLSLYFLEQRYDSAELKILIFITRTLKLKGILK